MDWNQSKLGYYLDFALVPVLTIVMLAALWTYLSAATLVSAALGAAVWSFLEYWIHRSFLHRLYRREHWLHHMRPGAYVAVPASLTATIHLLAMGGLLGTCGAAVGAGLFLGLEAGYLGYIWTHDRIHHAARKGLWLQDRWAHHDIHHQGAEVNFGVVSQFWDKAFGTYWHPSWGNAKAAKAASRRT